MGESMPLLKLVEVGGVLLAGVAFAWWQLRDVRQASRQTEEARAKAAREANGEEAPAGTAPDESREVR